MGQPFWETTYADLNAKSFGDATQEVMDLIPLLPAGGKVLDLGCGDGRNAIPLARAGLDVVAIDISQVGIHKLKTLAAQEGLTVQAHVADITSYRFSHEYDLIVSQACFHFMERSQWQRIIEECRTHTAANGFNAITVFTDEVPPPPDMSALCVGLFHEAELYTAYSDWDIILKKSYTFRDEHAGGIQHLHAANKLVARNCQTRGIQ